ncbi:aromatic ring-hydroxylating oxygenase subunit alpha [Flavobacterium sp. CF136]|uniref:aromatic ring-hydroxylating oxygenase subunit alpha n=1 Tax=Flavobacterium sp. (strain CF136) TaxID=1144313 RepID=UPI0002715228|nr:SRPBCC family protein [Flavobacterium sp. CF136]EJL66739.1 Rieske (2Fe-2S) domain-containing protein [Flavobacterium sp. CF136]
MKALIKPNEYFEKEIFEDEKVKLFSQCWNFIGFINDFTEINDFIVSEISGVSVIIQNLKGKIRAFKNVCSHRHSIIQTSKKGNRPLMCPYHGWAYNDKGIPFGIPKKPFFNFTKEELECLKLQEYSVEICGSLVFLKIKEDEITLQDYLGDFYGEIETMSNNFGKLIDLNEIEIACNWKIVVENTLESYHVALIHSETFKKLGADGLDFSFSSDHSMWNADVLIKENEGKQAKVHKPFQERNYKINGYKHLIVFPNILISSTYGISFNLSQIIPLTEDKTLFKSFVFMTKKESNNGSILEKVYEESLVDFNRKVFDEDKTICQEVQKGVKFSSYDGELSQEEERVLFFQEKYKKYLK